MGRICLEIMAELLMINDGEGAVWKCYVLAETGKPLFVLQKCLILYHLGPRLLSPSPYCCRQTISYFCSWVKWALVRFASSHCSTCWRGFFCRKEKTNGIMDLILKFVKSLWDHSLTLFNWHIGLHRILQYSDLQSSKTELMWWALHKWSLHIGRKKICAYNFTGANNNWTFVFA